MVFQTVKDLTFSICIVKFSEIAKNTFMKKTPQIYIYPSVSCHFNPHIFCFKKVFYHNYLETSLTNAKISKRPVITLNISEIMKWLSRKRIRKKSDSDI